MGQPLDFETKFFQRIIGKGGKYKNFEADKYDCIGLYFSASWCGPCLRFTPVLSTWYKNARAAGNKVEVVFVTRDRDEYSFNEYFSRMPWLAVNYVDKGEKRPCRVPMFVPMSTRCTEDFDPATCPLLDELAGTYGIRGLPTLIILDNEGNIVCQNGCEKILGHINDNDGYSDIPTWA